MAPGGGKVRGLHGAGGGERLCSVARATLQDGGVGSGIEPDSGLAVFSTWTRKSHQRPESASVAVARTLPSLSVGKFLKGSHI